MPINRKDKVQVTYYIPRRLWPIFQELSNKLGSNQAVINSQLVPYLEQQLAKKRKGTLDDDFY